MFATDTAPSKALWIVEEFIAAMGDMILPAHAEELRTLRFGSDGVDVSDVQKAWLELVKRDSGKATARIEVKLRPGRRRIE